MGFLTDALQEMEDHGFADTSPTRLTGFLNDSMWKLCAREPWTFLERETTLTWVADTATPDSGWPTDFSKALYLVIPTVGRIRPERRQNILNRYFSDYSESGSPFYYYFIGEQLYLFRTPDTTYTGVFGYLNRPAALVESTNEDPPVPEAHRRLITIDALIAAYKMEDDPDLAAQFKEEREDRYSFMREDCLRVQYDEPDYMVMVNEDEWEE